MNRRFKTLAPGTETEWAGHRVVYVDSRAGVRSAVTEPAAVVFLDGEVVRAHPDAIRWLATMSGETVVAVVGDVSDPLSELADATVDRPVTESAVETLTGRMADRRAYLDAVERYFGALERGADCPELDAVRTATEECAGALDPTDWRAVLD